MKPFRFVAALLAGASLGAVCGLLRLHYALRASHPARSRHYKRGNPQWKD